MAATRSIREIGPKTRFWLALAAGAVILVVAAKVAYYRMFTGFAVTDDEGYFLLSIKGVIAHGGLYDAVYSQYGPFYYDLFGGVFSVLGIAVGHDAGRWMVAVMWLAATALGAVAAYRITGSLVLGLFSEVLVFRTLGVNAADPMHPGALTSLLLLAAMAAVALVQPRWPRASMAALGALIAAILLTKVNLGVFALVAVGLACVATYAPLASRRGLRVAVEVVFVCTPLLLIRGDLDQAWARDLGLIAAVAALALVIALRPLAPDPGRRLAELGWLAGGLCVGTVLICVPMLIAGTSLGGLVRGAFTTPFEHRSGFEIPYLTPGWVLPAELAALGACIGYRVIAAGKAARERFWNITRPIASIAGGVLIAVLATQAWVPSTGYYPELWSLGLVWIALIPPRSEAPPGQEFARRLVPAVALLQGLHAYPVAATQVEYGSVLLVLVAAISVGNGLRDLASTPGRSGRRLAMGLASAAIVAALVVGNAFLRRPYDDAQDAYRAAAPLGLPGAGRMRVNAAQAAALRRVSGLLGRRCSTFVSWPGLNSFYLWTREEPPTWQNAGHWWSLLDGKTQLDVVRQARSHPRLCALTSPQVAHALGSPGPAGVPLLRFIDGGFRGGATVPPYRVLRRTGPRARP